MKNTKVDMRLNEVRDSIVTISKTLDNSKLTNRAIAVLICDANKDLRITQVESVLSEIPRLAKRYVKGVR